MLRFKTVLSIFNAPHLLYLSQFVCLVFCDFVSLNFNTPITCGDFNAFFYFNMTIFLVNNNCHTSCNVGCTIFTCQISFEINIDYLKDVDILNWPLSTEKGQSVAEER